MDLLQQMKEIREAKTDGLVDPDILKRLIKIPKKAKPAQYRAAITVNIKFGLQIQISSQLLWPPLISR